MTQQNSTPESAQEHERNGQRSMGAGGLIGFGLAGGGLLLGLLALFSSVVWQNIQPLQLGPSARLNLFPANDSQPDESWTELNVEGEERPVYVAKTPLITRDDITSYSISLQDGTELFHLNLQFTNDAASKLKEYSRPITGQRRRLAIFIDDALMSCPVVHDVLEGSVQVTLPKSSAEAMRKLQEHLKN